MSVSLTIRFLTNVEPPTIADRNSLSEEVAAIALEEYVVIPRNSQGKPTHAVIQISDAWDTPVHQAKRGVGSKDNLLNWYHRWF